MIRENDPDHLRSVLEPVVSPDAVARHIQFNILRRILFPSNSKILDKLHPHPMDILTQNRLSRLSQMRTHASNLRNKLLIHITSDIGILTGNTSTPSPQSRKRLRKRRARSADISSHVL